MAVAGGAADAVGGWSTERAIGSSAEVACDGLHQQIKYIDHWYRLQYGYHYI